MPDTIERSFEFEWNGLLVEADVTADARWYGGCRETASCPGEPSSAEFYNERVTNVKAWDDGNTPIALPPEVHALALAKATEWIEANHAELEGDFLQAVADADEAAYDAHIDRLVEEAKR